jgi:hypothetical protein
MSCVKGLSTGSNETFFVSGIKWFENLRPRKMRSFQRNNKPQGGEDQANILGHQMLELAAKKETHSCKMPEPWIEHGTSRKHSNFSLLLSQLSYSGVILMTALVLQVRMRVLSSIIHLIPPTAGA